jgi:hypothetical protein
MKNFACGGTINPARFVKRSTAADFTVLQADADAFPCGISQRWAAVAPLSGASTAAGISGDMIQVHQPGMSGDPHDSTVWLEVGSGGVTRGALLMPDADGKGITCTTGKYYGAIADESGAADEFIRVTPISGILA